MNEAEKSRVEALEQCADLHRRGLLTDEKFAERKARILAGTRPRARRPSLLVVSSVVLLVAVIGGVVVWGLTQAQRSGKVAASAPAAAGLPAPPPPMRVAFKLAFPTGADVQLKTNGTQELARYHFEPVAVVLIQGGAALISKGAMTDAAHVDSGVLAIHYLAEGPTGWRVAGGWPDFAETGSFGEIGSAKVRGDLFDGPAVQLEGGGTWQGCSLMVADLVELTPSRPTVRAKDVPTAYSLEDAGADPVENATTASAPSAVPTPAGGQPGETEGKIVAVQRGRAFSVRYDGAYARTVTYQRQGDVFRPSANSAGLPSC